MSAAIALALKNWKLVAGGLVLLALGIALMVTRATLDSRTAQLKAEKAAHEQTVGNYRAAAEIARREDAENLLRVQTEQQQITERIVDEYQDRLASATTRYDRLRQQADVYSGTAGSAEVSADRDATCRAYAGTDCDRLPALLREAQANTDQLVALQGWVREQVAVDVSGDEGNGQ